MSTLYRVSAWGLFFILMLGMFEARAKAAEKVDFNPKVLNSLKPAVIVKAQGESWSITDRMVRYRVPGLSIAIVRNHQLVYQKGFGRLEQGASTPITTTTQFQAASLSKAITALGVLRLVDEGKLSLDKSVNAYLKGWQLPSGDSTTLRQVLSHSGGVNVPSYPGFSDTADLPSLKDILEGNEKSSSDPVRVELNKNEYHYSGGGYMVLQKIIEDVSGQSFESFMKTRLFDKYQADLTHFNTMNSKSANNVAFGHLYSGQSVNNGWLHYPQSAAAGLWSTPTDLAQLLMAVMKAYHEKPDGLFSSQTTKALSSPVVEGMGLGFGAHGEGLDRHIDHAGWTKGYRAYMAAFLERGDAVVIMSNGDAGNRLIEEIMRALAFEFNWNAYPSRRIDALTWSESELQRLEGHYRMQPAGFAVSIEVNNDHLKMTTPRGTTHEIYPIADDKLIMIEDASEIQFDKHSGQLKFWGMTAEKLPPILELK